MLPVDGAATLGVNVLATHQDQIALRFAQRGVDRFADLSWSIHDGAPALDDIHAWTGIEVESLVPAGDHVVVHGPRDVCFRRRPRAADLLAAQLRDAHHLLAGPHGMIGLMTTREFWRSIEAIHDVVYLAPDAKERFEAIGLKGFWMGYVASRSAALGTPGPQVVTALFHGFAPAQVARALPAAWALADRDEILTTRRAVARDALARALGDLDVSRTADTTVRLAEQLDLAGRPLAAAHRSLPVPDAPLDRLWWGATVLREYRGDSHVAVLTAAGLDGAGANALAAATGLVPMTQHRSRGWSEEQWIEAFGRLQQFGWVDGTTATDTGRAARERLEDATDRSCGAGLTQEATARAFALVPTLLPIARTLEAAGAVSYPNPTGVPAP